MGKKVEETTVGRCPACQGKGFNALTLKQCKICRSTGDLAVVWAPEEDDFEIEIEIISDVRKP